MIKHLEKDNLEELVKDDFTIVDFYADWCGPCKMLAPILESLNDLNIIKVNIDEFRDLAIKYGIMSVPTMIFYKNGSEVGKETGFRSKEELESIVKRLN